CKVGRAFDHDERHRPVALQLQHDGALELDVGGQQDGGGCEFAQQTAYAFRVMLMGQAGLPRRFEPDCLDAGAVVGQEVFLEGVGHYGILADHFRAVSARTAASMLRCCSRARSTWRRTWPSAVSGSRSTNSTSWGTCQAARRCRT